MSPRFAEAVPDRIHLGTGLFNRAARLKARQDKSVGPALFRCKGMGGSEVPRSPDLLGAWEGKARRKDAGDRAEFSVKQQSFARHSGIRAETFAPERIADYHGIPGAQPAPDRRRHAC